MRYLNEYEAYGGLINDAKNAGQEKKDSTEPLNPTAIGFYRWNNKTYSGKELDQESDDNYYGSRFYDPQIGLWNKQDSYRGGQDDVMSRHRYMFVKNNPVNLVDYYGFSDDFKAKVDELGNRYVSWNRGEYGKAEKQRDYHQGRVNYYNRIIPGLRQDMVRKQRAAYKARMVYYDHKVMGGVIGRLRAKGYEMDYGMVGAYLSNKIQEKGRIYSVKQSQYVRARGKYYGAVSQRNYHRGQVNYYQGVMNGLDTALGEYYDWKESFDIAYEKTGGQGESMFNKGLEGDYGQDAQAEDVARFLQDIDFSGLQAGFNRFLVPMMTQEEKDTYGPNFFLEGFMGGIQEGFDAAKQEQLQAQQLKVEQGRQLLAAHQENPEGKSSEDLMEELRRVMDDDSMDPEKRKEKIASIIHQMEWVNDYERVEAEVEAGLKFMKDTTKLALTIEAGAVLMQLNILNGMIYYTIAKDQMLQMADQLENPVSGLPREGSGLKNDYVKPVYDSNGNIVKEFPSLPKAHGFPDIIDNYATHANEFSLENGATLYQIEGSYNGVSGRFEWIVDDGAVTHRMFVEGGAVNGVPISK